MIKNLAYVMAQTTQFEGGYVNHPKDPGGPTNHGITLATLRAWRKRPVTAEDVRNLSKDEAIQILKTGYWDAVRGDELPSGLDLTMVDFATNSGPSRAIKELQAALGTAADGVLGVKTMALIPTNPEAVANLCDAVNDRRLKFCKSLKRGSLWKSFGRGWTIRITGKDPKGQYAEQPGIDTLSRRLALREMNPSVQRLLVTPNVLVTEAGKARDTDIGALATTRGKVLAGTIAASATSAVSNATGIPSWILSNATSLSSIMEPLREWGPYIGYAIAFLTAAGSIYALYLNTQATRAPGVEA